MTMTEDRSLWLRRFQPTSASRVSLICFPHAGGSASYYVPVAGALAPEVDVIAVQYPGRQDRRTERVVDSIGELADSLFAVLRPRLQRPFAFFGHSMGAVVAFEVAQRMEAEPGPSPRMLFASGRRAPSRYRREIVHLRSDEGIIDEIRRLNGTDTRLLGDEELLWMILPALRGDYRAIETYRWLGRDPLRCPVTVLMGDRDPHTTLDEAQAWSLHTTGGFDLHAFPGGHFYLNTQQGPVLDVVSKVLATAG